MRIDGPTGPLEVTELGPADAPAFVALGGTERWAPTFETLARRWRCVAFDGGTSAADVEAVLDHVGPGKVVLAAEGDGAAAGVTAVLAHHHRIDALVLVDTDLDPASPDLAALHLPALVLHGQDDPEVPVSRAQAVSDAVRGSELILVAGGGHEPSVAKPHLLVDLIDTWARRRLDWDLA